MILCRDSLLTGRLEQLDEIDYGGSVRVQARLSAELMNLRTGAIVWTGDASQTLEARPAKRELRRLRDGRCRSGERPAPYSKYAARSFERRNRDARGQAMNKI
jgi:hypothetical protein